MTKPIVGISNKMRFKPACSATGTSEKVENLLVAGLEIILSNKRITKVLFRLHGCPGWSAPLLFANSRREVFSCRGPFGHSMGISLFETLLIF